MTNPTKVIKEINNILVTAAQNCSENKALYESKPQLKVWSTYIMNALKEKREFHQNPQPIHCYLETRKEFWRAVRIAVAKQLDIDQEYT